MIILSKHTLTVYLGLFTNRDSYIKHLKMSLPAPDSNFIVLILHQYNTESKDGGPVRDCDFKVEGGGLQNPHPMFLP